MNGRQGSWSLGVDAGASRCRARLRAFDGTAVAEAEGPAANTYVNFERAAEVARAVIAEVLARAGLRASDTSNVKLGLGVAGVGGVAEAARFAACFEGFAGVSVVNDAVAACIGAHAGADGGLLIVGTGSAGIARVGGREEIVGGRGFHLGDDGSAARLGLEAARATMRALDGLGPASDLTKQIAARHADPLAMVHWAAAATPRDYGDLAPLVIAAASNGEDLAKALVAGAAAAVETLLARVEALGAPRVAMIGGLGEALRPFLTKAASARLHAPLFDPTDGAIALVGGRLPEAAPMSWPFPRHRRGSAARDRRGPLRQGAEAAGRARTRREFRRFARHPAARGRGAGRRGLACAAPRRRHVHSPRLADGGSAVLAARRLLGTHAAARLPTSSRNLDVGVFLPSPEEMTSLAVGPDESVVRLSRLRLADDVPMAIEHTAAPARFLPAVEKIGPSLYDALAATGHSPTRGLQRLRAMLLSDDDAALLGVPSGSPVLYIQRIAYLADGRCVEFTRSYYRSDTYEFVSEVSPGRTHRTRA